MACPHKDSRHNLMVLQELPNLGICPIKVLLLPNRMVQIYHRSSHTLMHPVDHHKLHILLLMDLPLLQMVTATHHLLLALCMHNQVLSRVTVNLQPNRHLVMAKLLLLEVTGHIHLHSKLTLNSSQLLTMQFMVTKHPKILLLTVVPLHQHIVQRQQRSQAMLNQRLLRLHMISLTHKQQQLMGLHNPLLQLHMPRLCRLSLHIPKLMTQLKLMLHRDDFI